MNFLNDSLKTLKTVLAEGLDQTVSEFDSSSSSQAKGLDVNNEQIENLKKLCHHQSEEIEVLRKQIFEYQQSRLSDISHSSKSLTEENAQKQQQQQQQQSHNESWFWEQETSSTSSKRDGNGSPPDEVDVDLTTIPLDSNDQEIAEKLRRQIVDREKTLKLLSAENAELNEKLKNSFKENQELERNIEELDHQHQIAIEKVLDVKKSVQVKLSKSIEEKEQRDKENNEKLEKISREKNEVENQLKQITEITKSYEQQIEDLNESNLTLETEVSELKNAPKAIVNSNNDHLKKINLLVNTNFNLSETFVNESLFMENFSKFLTKISFELSALADENKLIKDEISKYANERDKLKSELINYEIECSELVKNNNILMADIETLRGRKLETIMENEDEENMVVADAIDGGVADSNQDDFNSIRTKLDETEAERSEYYEEVHQLKREIAEHVTKCKLFQEEIENLENEKSNYLFELNELKSEEERNFLQREVKTYKERELELSSKVEIVEKENIDLKEKLELLETNFALQETNANTESQRELENLRNIRDEAILLEKNNEELKFELNLLRNELEELRCENGNLVLKSEELQKIHDSNIENLKKTNEFVQELQQQLLVTRSSEELKLKLQDELNNLKSQNEVLESEALKSEKTQQELFNKLENLQISESQNSQLSEKLLGLENQLSKLSEENVKLSADYQQSQKIIDEISEKLKKSEEVVGDLNSSKSLETDQSSEEAQAEIYKLEELSARLTKEKEELIALLTTKHNENVQYHNEIIRLTQMYKHEAQKVQSLTDENSQIRVKLESFAENILQEQNNNRLFMQEKNDLLEQNNLLNKDIERLRQHLLEVADAYTFEQVSLQKQVEDYKSKYIEIGNEVKKSSTAFTSANIRANQQAETLQTQYNLLLQQRDDLLAKLSAAEDKDNKNQAALTNLQVALEIFQKDKERDIDMRTTTLQRELHEDYGKQMKMKNEIQQLNLQLQEAKNGLMAATRLSEQLELNQLTIDRLNNDIKSYQQVNDSLRKKLEESNANLSNADIDLIKNLVIGYLSAPNSNAKTQILKLISTVLHLSDSECVKIGLKSAGFGSWISQGSNDTVNNNRSLTEAFVAFLEKESEPRVNANLLTIHETETTSAATRKSSTASNPQEVSSTNPQEQIESGSSSVTLNLNDNALLTPYSNRNSSTILKDLLHDT